MLLPLSSVLNSTKSRVMVVGGSGFLGKALVNFLKPNYLVYSLSGISHGRILIGNGDAAASYSISYSENSLRETIYSIQPQTIIYASGLVGDEKCSRDPQTAYFANAYLLAEVANLARSLQAKLIIFSTDAVFSDNQEERYELSTPKPDSVYGKSKLMGEFLARENYPDSIVLRTNFFGSGVTTEKGLLNFFVNNLSRATPCVGYSNVFFNPISEMDLLFCTQSLIERYTQGLFHIVGDETLSKAKFGRIVAQSIGANESLIIEDKKEFGRTKMWLEKKTSNEVCVIQQDLRSSIKRICDSYPIHNTKKSTN